ncbi:MAG: 50S ribosomal protein L10 [Chloroflexi bacterium]|nr:MAG: 50S ribosomal protein L10 [Chloroflexota bacterium]
MTAVGTPLPPGGGRLVDFRGIVFASAAMQRRFCLQKGGGRNLALTRERKEMLVRQFAEMAARSSAIIFTENQGLTVAEMTQVRRRVREAEGAYHVVKNTLLRLALAQAGLPVPDDLLRGPTAVSFCMGEVPPVAKALVEATKDLERLQIKGGILEGRVMDPEGIQALAELPTRDVLMAQVLGGIQGPARQVAGVVAGSIRQILNLLQARIEQLEAA